MVSHSRAKKPAGSTASRTSNIASPTGSFSSGQHHPPHYITDPKGGNQWGINLDRRGYLGGTSGQRQHDIRRHSQRDLRYPTFPHSTLSELSSAPKRSRSLIKAKAVVQ